MPNTGQVHWHEGLFLQPHHLQWAQRQSFEQSAGERRLSWSHPYGLIDARVSGDALENMLVRFDRLRAVMPSGIEVNVPDAADLPPLDIKKELEGSTQPFVIELGVPLWYGTRANSIEYGPDQDWRVKRLYRVAEIARPDENTGENPQAVLVRRVNARLLLPGDDRTDMETLPLLRVSHATGQDVGKPRVDPGFVPACMVLAGSPTLRELVRDLANQVEASRKELVIQITRGGFAVDMMRGIQFEQMLRLRTLNHYSGSLPSMVATPSTTPFDVYLKFRELLGELAALRPDRDQFDAPPYDHDNPMVSFGDLSSRIRSLLRGTVAPNFMQAQFVKAEGMMLAALTDEHMSRPNEYYLGVKTKDDPRAVARLVENGDEFKLMAKSMVQRNIFGVKLQEERHPPLELPSQTGLNYFRLNRAESQRMWDKVKEEKEVAVRWPGLETSDFVITLYMTIPGTGGGAQGQGGH